MLNHVPGKLRLIIEWLLDEIVLPFLPEKGEKDDSSKNGNEN